MIKVMIIAACMLISTCGDTFADIYQYTDERGEIHMTTDPGAVPERRRGQVKVMEDTDQAGSSSAETAPPPPAAAVHNEVDLQSRPDGPATNAIRRDEQVQPEPPPTVSQQPVVTIMTDTQHTTAAGEFVNTIMQHMLNEKFKDVKDPSQVPALNSSPVGDCTKYKTTLMKDVDAMEQLMKNAEEKKKKGDMSTFAKIHLAMGGLASVVNFIYDIAFTPKQCSEEFERENKERLESFNKYNN